MQNTPNILPLDECYLPFEEYMQKKTFRYILNTAEK